VLRRPWSVRRRVTCHDHDRQTTQWQKPEPAQLKSKAHFNTLKQLDDPKALAYARAIGLADPYDVKGDCVKCHATVFRGDANAGVSCESCHGPASGYLEPHQPKGAYAQPWPRACATCVTSPRRSRGVRGLPRHARQAPRGGRASHR
jgi:hypothetical protein